MLAVDRPKVSPVQIAALLAVGGCVAIAALVNVPWGMRCLSLLLAVLGVLRVFLDKDVVIGARSRAFDVTVLLGSAIGIGYLSFGPNL